MNLEFNVLNGKLLKPTRNPTNLEMRCQKDKDTLRFLYFLLPFLENSKEIDPGICRVGSDGTSLDEKSHQAPNGRRRMEDGGTHTHVHMEQVSSTHTHTPTWSKSPPHTRAHGASLLHTHTPRWSKSPPHAHAHMEQVSSTHTHPHGASLLHTHTHAWSKSPPHTHAHME